MSSFHDEPPPSPFGDDGIADDDGDVELAESDSVPIVSTGYSDDPDAVRAREGEAREIRRDSPYLPPGPAVTCATWTCAVLGVFVLLTTGYAMGKSSNEKIDKVMGFAAPASSPEADFAAAETVEEPESEHSEEDRMEVLRASIGETTLTLDEVIKESEEWDESEIPKFPETIDIAKMSDTDKLLFTFLAKYPFARDFVAELVMDDYTDPESNAYDVGAAGEVYARLDNALEAMELYEVDYEPVKIEGHPFLYVGSVGASLTYGSLTKAGITHIVDLSTTAKCDLFKDDIEYLCLDGFHKDGLDELDEAVEFVEHARKKGGKVLSHDWYGTAHSGTLAAAYLMKHEGMRAKDAVALIRKSRPVAQPNEHILEKYAKGLS